MKELRLLHVSEFVNMWHDPIDPMTTYTIDINPNGHRTLKQCVSYPCYIAITSKPYLKYLYIFTKNGDEVSKIKFNNKEGIWEVDNTEFIGRAKKICDLFNKYEQEKRYKEKFNL